MDLHLIVTQFLTEKVSEAHPHRQLSVQASMPALTVTCSVSDSFFFYSFTV